MFYILRGNHDASRNSQNRTSFDLFEAIVSSEENIVCLTEPLLVHDDRIGLCPYSVFGTAEEFLQEILSVGTPELVVGHWDIAFGADNLIPTQLMQEADITYAVTGHDHLRRREKRHGVEIEVYGSMQPYSHSEDATGEWYVTVTLEEALNGDFKNKNVRVLLKDGEILPTDIECLSIVGKRITTDEKIEVDTSEFESFNMAEALAEAIPEVIRERVMKVYYS
jgi:DNA repair exonuclease SbcCD nuclease subunit